jgi:hypothetical protein
MFFFGIFIFFSVRRIDKIISLNLNSVSKELEMEKEKEKEKEKTNSNFTELLQNRSNITLASPWNQSYGKDMRWIEEEEAEKKETEIKIQTIRKNAAKMQLISFLENPQVTDIQKIERIRDPEMVELLSSNHSSNEKIRGVRMEAGGFWKDWDDAIFLFL